MALSVDELNSLMAPYSGRTENLKQDIVRQIGVFNAVYDEILNADVVILNAEGNSNLNASTEFVRLTQMGYCDVYETNYKFTPGIRVLSQKGKCVLLSISGSGNEKIAEKVKTIYKDKEKYGIDLDLTSLGISASPESPLKKVCDVGKYFVITANNKFSDANNEDLCHYMGEDSEKESQILLNIICRLVAKEKGISEAMMREGHNPWF
ncbi:MAG: hypothetical protein ABIF85_00750 [Nanoarchaeota archaeon]|nr:hypothetical protein [Nanoarchaeota archaeon]MBU4300463.1 hypothetical protein [Nanoarchaeota archaeon]MBU4451943.1 hypothetical protein [Nanoarchaeota archaeon]MCG2724102.1 hypothetical protein [archaeon]